MCIRIASVIVNCACKCVLSLQRDSLCCRGSRLRKPLWKNTEKIHQKWQLNQRYPGGSENHESSEVWFCFPRSNTSSFMMHWLKQYSVKKQKSLRLTFMPMLMLSWYLDQQERPDWRNNSRWAFWDSSMKIFRFLNLNDLKVGISTQLSSAFST